MFLTPEGKPLFGGTYFPKRSRYNRPGFDDVLARVAEVWAGQRAQVMAHGDELVHALADALAVRRADDRAQAGAGDRTDALQTTAAWAASGLRDALMPAFDQVDGGFGDAPKFPQPAVLDALLRHAVAAHDDTTRDAVLLTLRRIAEGGLYDHLGGGFCRYSTDARWMIPHFEKMLYDSRPPAPGRGSLAAHARTTVAPSVRGHGRLADSRDARQRRRLFLQHRCRL
jgi:uncharacterized protein YyaL (SSP411 family)